MKRLITILSFLVWATTPIAEEISNIDVDWLGNDIIIVAFADPDVDGEPQSYQGLNRGEISGRIGGATDARTGGIGNLLGSLGISGTADNGEAGITGQSKKDAMNAALREPVDAAALVMVTPHRTREGVYSAALLIGDPRADIERAFLATLAADLGFQQHDLDRLDSAIGKPRLTLG